MGAQLMVKFRCRRSGNYVTFSNEDDIKQLRTHEEYEEIKDEITSKNDAGIITEQKDAKESLVDRPSEGKIGDEANEGNDEGQKRSVLKKRGRPAKK